MFHFFEVKQPSLMLHQNYDLLEVSKEDWRGSLSQGFVFHPQRRHLSFSNKTLMTLT